MKTLFALIILAGIAVSLCAQPQWMWAAAAGGPYSDRGRGVACDDAGNMYVTGYFRVSADFDTIHVVGQGGTSADIFVAKYDAQGKIVWVAQAGSAGTDEGCALVLDAAGNIYVTGYVGSTAMFGGLTLPVTGTSNLFVACLSNAGVWLWVSSGSSSLAAGCDLILGGDGCLYACGYYSGSLNLGGYEINSEGSNDIWAAKLDLAGNWLWLSGAGGAGDDRAAALAWDSAGAAVITGIFRGNAIFGSTTLIHNSNPACFLAWLSDEGNWSGVEALSATTRAQGNDVAVDSDSNVYVTGMFSGILTAGNIQLTGDSMGDAFIAKYSPRGLDCLWAHRVGANSDDSGLALALAPSGAVYWVGYFLYTINLGPFTLTYVSSADLFLARLDAQGDYLMALQAGGVCEDMAQSMCADSCGNVYVAGYYDGEMYFGDYYLPFRGDEHIFCAKLHETVSSQDPCLPTPLPGLSVCPNPFAGSTAIRFDLETATNLEVAVYDLRGRRVRLLTSGACAPGRREISWDGCDECGGKLPAGLYFCRLRSPQGERVSKLILLR